MSPHAVKAPVIVRRPASAGIRRPGFHRRSARQAGPRSRDRAIRAFQFSLLVLGLILVGCYVCGMAEQSLYQGYQNWAFEQQIAGDSAVTFVQYVRECTPFGFLFGKVDSERAAALGIRGGHKSPVPAKGERLAVGSTVGRLTIPRLNLAAVVREGTDPEILKRSVGHVPVTALPGQTGNFAIAAHRDTLFRGLKDVRVQDEVVVETQSERFVYRVIATEIVSPSDVSVLRADGGGVRAIQAGPNEKPGPSKLLTMITCYPFNFVGSAPKRFIVEASMISAVRVHNTLASTSM